MEAYSVIVPGLVTAVGTILAAVVSAFFVKKFARNAAAGVQTPEQIEGRRIIDEAKADADEIRSDAKAEAAAIIADANSVNARAHADQQRFHDKQISIMAEELALLRDQRDGKTS